MDRLGISAIGTPFGLILKFQSLPDLDQVIEELTRMRDWGKTMWENNADYPVKLAYMVKPDNLSDEDKQWLDDFTDRLENAVKA